MSGHCFSGTSVSALSGLQSPTTCIRTHTGEWSNHSQARPVSLALVLELRLLARPQSKLANLCPRFPRNWWPHFTAVGETLRRLVGTLLLQGCMLGASELHLLSSRQAVLCQGQGPGRGCCNRATVAWCQVILRPRCV